MHAESCLRLIFSTLYARGQRDAAYRYQSVVASWTFLQSLDNVDGVRNEDPQSGCVRRQR